MKSDWKKVKLDEIAEITMGQSPRSSSYNEDFDGLPLLNGAADYKSERFFPKKYTTEPTKIAKSGDLLMGVRATIGNFTVANKDYCIGRGVAAISANEKLVNKYYLLRVIENNLEKFLNNSAGSTIKGIKREDLTNMIVMLPNLEEQNKISRELDQANALIEKRKKAIELLDEYLKSVFLDMFGDPVTNPKGWEKNKLSELGKLDRGVSKHRPRNAPELLGGEHPLIQTGEVARADLFIKNYTHTYSEIGLKQSKKWPTGTLCITIAANIARTGILQFDACFPDSIVGFVPNERKTTNIFIHYWVSFLQKILEDSAPESAQKNINLQILRNLDVITPSLKSQKVFSEEVINSYLLKNKMRKQLVEFENEFHLLMKKYF